MKTLLVGVLALLLTGCAFGGGTPGDANLADLQKFTVADLNAALADAKAHGDETAAQCYSTLVAVIATGLPSLPPAPVGAVSAFQILRDLAKQGPSQAQGIAEKVNLGCAPLFIDSKVTIGKLLLLVK